MVPRKANTPTLTREQIVTVAMAIVDRDGLNALTMRKLASELGVGAMTLYYHVPDKSTLYDLILEAVMAEVDFSADAPSAPVEERLVSLAYSLRRALLAHPHAVTIVLSRSLRTPAQLKPVEKMLGVMFELGLSAEEAVSTVDIVGHYIFGATASYANHLADTEYHDEVTEEDVISGITAEEFPNLIHAYSAAKVVGWETNFETGLRTLVRGLITERISSERGTGA